MPPSVNESLVKSVVLCFAGFDLRPREAHDRRVGEADEGDLGHVRVREQEVARAEAQQ